MPDDDLFDGASAPAEDGTTVKRDRFGRYLLPDPTSQPAKGRKAGDKAFTRVTTFAKSISDTYTLSMWQMRMAMKGLTLRPDLFALVAATDLSDRETLNKIAEDAKDASAARAAANIGTALHAFTEQADALPAERREEWILTHVPEPWTSHVRAYDAAMQRHGLEAIPEWIERIVICRRFGIAGTFDRILRVTRDTGVAVYDFTTNRVAETTLRAGTLVIGDLKTGRDLEYGWNEITIQLATYANADHLASRLPVRSYESMPKVDKTVGIVMHLPSNRDAETAECTIYAVNLEAGWEAAELCAKVRQWRKTRNLAYPLSTTEVVQPNGFGAVPVTRELTWREKIERASSTSELSTIRKQAIAAGEWNDDLLTIGLKRKSQLATA